MEIKVLRSDIILVVDYKRSVKEMIDAGNYHSPGWEVIGENFFIPSSLLGKKFKLLASLFKFNLSFERGELKRMIGHNYRFPNFFELLSLGEQYPDMQRENTIVALGSTFKDNNGNHYALSLTDIGGRRFDLTSVDGKLNERFAFLGINIHNIGAMPE